MIKPGLLIEQRPLLERDGVEFANGKRSGVRLTK
jgi:hypothetical protein